MLPPVDRPAELDDVPWERPPDPAPLVAWARRVGRERVRDRRRLEVVADAEAVVEAARDRVLTDLCQDDDLCLLVALERLGDERAVETFLDGLDPQRFDAVERAYHDVARAGRLKDVPTRQEEP